MQIADMVLLIKSMKIRTVEATIHHAESNKKEIKRVTIFDDKPEYGLTKVYVVELGKSAIFEKDTNTILLPD
jgi:hypothetical protein